MPRRTLVILFLAVVVSYACYRRTDRNPYARYFAQVLEEIDEHYIEPVDEQKLFEGAISGMVGKLDDYSGFISRKYAGEFQRMILDQKFGGIGIEVAHDKKTRRFTVMTPIVGTPAYEAGIRAGDLIVAVDGRPTRELDGNAAIEMLRGRPGEPVTLEVIHQGETKPKHYRMVRREISVDSVLGDTRNPDDSWNFFLPGHEKIGYLRITSFGERTVDECQAALQWLHERKMRGLILDLRDDPGGLLKAAIGVCELFLTQGDLIVTTRGRDKKVREEFPAERSGAYRDLPLVVLVNRNSASASEIVAAALQDHGRALVVGERSYGKGTVQNVIPIEAGKSVLKLTIATYWRPSGKNIHRLESSKPTDAWGVEPNPGCEVKLSAAALAAWEKQRRARDLIWAKGKGPADNAAAAVMGDIGPQESNQGQHSSDADGERSDAPQDEPAGNESAEPQDQAAENDESPQMSDEQPASVEEPAGDNAESPNDAPPLESESGQSDEADPAAAEPAESPLALPTAGSAPFQDLQLDKAVECLEGLIEALERPAAA